MLASIIALSFSLMD
ncbi:uncharacterized protein FFNC_14565 [Fusarium fujikuroi]|nr:uncharacterized protein FFNC_14565 [Fusarium fujikuroi]